jgi:hypothetical protein
VAGGGNFMLITAELYNPASGSWSPTGSLTISREGHTATLLRNGTVLVAGGIALPGAGFVTASAEIYDPVAGTWAGTGSLATARDIHSATLLPDGTVLVTGGRYDSPTTDETIASAELYDPAAGTWSSTGSLRAARAKHTATLLANGVVLLAGGVGDAQATTTCESYL